jgi:Tfp pilus assembly protein PilV
MLNPKECFSPERGSSLIEVILIISIVVFAVSALAFLLWQTTSTQHSAQALLAATTVAQNIMDYLRSKSFQEIVDTYNLEENPSLELDLANFWDGDNPAPDLSLLPGILENSYLSFTREAEDKIKLVINLTWKEPTNRLGQERSFKVATYIVKGGLNDYIVSSLE